MMKIIQIINIIKKDSIEAFRNKTILIVFIIPLIASLLFTLIGNSTQKNFNIGLIQDNVNLKNFISNNVSNFNIYSYANTKSGKKAIQEGEISGLIIDKSKNNNPEFKFFVDEQKPNTYMFLKSNIKEMLHYYLNIEPNIQLEVVGMNNSNLDISFIPMWITITMSLIGILVVAGNFAEEKENKTLDALLVTPTKDIHILIGKALFGIVFIFFTVFFMFILNRIEIINFIQSINLFLLILSASICLTAIGLFIGVVSESQTSARSIGTMVYFPILFPTLISDLSSFTERLAHFFPTYYLYSGLNKILLYKDIKVYDSIIVLTVFGLLFSFITYIKFNGGFMNAKE